MHILAVDFFDVNKVKNNFTLEKIELIIKRDGSQLKLKNIFNEQMDVVEEYSFKIIGNLNESSEISVNSYEVKLSTLKNGSLLDGFNELTNILCNIE